MKGINSTIALFACFLILSCSNDEGTVTFSELSGKIDGIDFTVREATYDINQDNKLEFDIYSSESNDICFEIPDGVRIFFTSDNSVGRQDLFLDASSFEAFTVTLFNPATFNNIIATDGYLNVIENNADTITAELDINVDSDNFVKGQFTAILCN